MLSYSEFPVDIRVRREAKALIKAGYSLSLVCITTRGESLEDTVDGVEVYRMPFPTRRGGYLRYAYNYIFFTVSCLRKLSELNKKRMLDVVHIHNPPNFLLFAAIPLKLFSKTRIILDIHDPLPEMLASRFKRKMSDPFIRLLEFCESKTARFADVVITVNDLIQKELLSKGVESLVVMNSTPLTTKEFDAPKGDGFKVIAVGNLIPHRDLETVMDAVKLMREEVPGIELHVVGGGEKLEELKKKAIEAGLSESIIFYGELDHSLALDKIAGSDACVIAFEDTPIGRISVPHKLFEYLAFEKPVILPRLPGLQSMVGEDAGYFFTAGNKEEVAECMLEIYRNPGDASAKGKKAAEIHRKYSWDKMEGKLVDCYNQLSVES